MGTPTMLRHLIIAAALLIGVALAPRALSDEAQPHLEVDRIEFDFGTALAGGSVEHTFVLKNIGKADLVVESVRSTCGCTSLQHIEKVKLEPGNTLDVPISLSLKGRSGAQRRSIVVISNDPQMPELTLWMVGDAIQPIRVDPHTLALGRIEANHPTAVVQVVAARGRQFTIESIASSMPEIEAHVVEVVPGELYQIKVRAVRALPAGQLAQTLTIETSDPDMPTIVIPITGHVMDDFAIAPRELVILSTTSSSTRYIVIAPGEIKLFDITKIDVPDKRIIATILKAGQHGYRVRLSGIPADTALDGKSIVMHTNVPSHPTIEVPIRVITEDDSAEIRNDKH